MSHGLDNEDSSLGWCGSDGDSTGCSPPNVGGLRMDRPQRKEHGHSRKPSASSLSAFTGASIQGTDSGFESTTPHSRMSSTPIQVASQNHFGLNGSPPVSFFHTDSHGLVDMSPAHPYAQRRTPTPNP